MLVSADVTAAARILLNELTAGFWLASDFVEFLKQAAIDISARTLCYEQKEVFTLATGTQEYAITTANYLKVLGIRYNNTLTGLYRIPPWLEGLQEVSIDGAPKYYYDFDNNLGVIPKPTATQNGHTLTAFLAVVTSDITSIPDRFRMPAILFAVMLGLIKERQYSKALQLFQLYQLLLSSDRAEVLTPKVEPPPLDTYTLKAVTSVPQNAQ